jgi:hypothetical protein
MATDVSKRVVHCKVEPYDVYIGRPSKWGNPFEIGRDGTREDVIQKYYRWIVDERPDLLAQLVELRGKVLGCWCAPKPCHGDVLVELSSYPSYKCITCGCSPCGLSEDCRRCEFERTGVMPSTLAGGS